MLIVVKYLVSAAVIVAVSEIAKHSDKIGAIISSLPLVTIMVMIWLHLEKQGSAKIGNHAYYTFWYVLPTMPMFLLMPWLMEREVNFWLALLFCAMLTGACFFLSALFLKRFGINLLP